jgi:hypothetical protein
MEETMSELITILTAVAQSGFFYVGLGGFALALVVDRL